MVKQLRKSAFIPLIIIGGMMFLWLLMVEYQKNQSLLTSNQQLLADATKRSLITQLNSQFNSLPNNFSELQTNWIKYEPNFYWFQQQQPVFPPKPSDASSLWDSYWQDLTSTLKDDQRKASLSKLMQERVDNIKDMASALEANDQQSLRALMQVFLSQKENFQLTATEEIASSLMLLEVGKNKGWSQSLVDSILFQGFQSDNIHIRSAFNLLIDNVNRFNREDTQAILNLIEGYAERVNLPLDRLRDYRRAILKSETSLHSLHCTQKLVIGQDKISKAYDAENCIVIPIDLPQELKSLTSQLIQRGQLDPNDSINWNMSRLPESEQELTLTIDRPSWGLQETNQQWFMLIKVIILIILVSLSIYAVQAIQLEHQRKEHYIQLKEDFVNLVSHELKTPLASIRLMAETLDKRLTKKLDGKDYPKRIEREADRLWLMVDNILSFNRLQSEKMSINKTSISLKSLVDEVQESLPEDIIINNKISPDAEALVDKPLFSLVLLNLVSNAVKYNNHSQVELTFESSINSQGLNSILVSDNGIGIDKALWADIFEPFFQAHHKQKKGFGLGLALSLKVMQIHNGSLRILQSKTLSEADASIGKINNLNNTVPYTTGTQWELTFQ